ncbi:MAG: FAD:protein FMN transferase [Alphaproteobacteria bacterium]|nr:FAD:protein FMN transferase [Alphaproteobacteria bacterium]
MLTRLVQGHLYQFRSMASPCEVHIETNDQDIALRLGRLAEAEATRVEYKYSRYRDDSLLSAINASNGQSLPVDEETAALLDYASNCYALSDGRFDVTSGILRKVWRFDGSDRLPSKASVRELLPFVGWNKITWRSPIIQIPPGMEIDFGGIGKEYAVDRAIEIIEAASDVPVLVNFGGDLRASKLRADGTRWRVDIESVDRSGPSGAHLEIGAGALTTSGDARRYLLKDGVRYSHILDPRTGWPVKDPPRSVTVAATTCLEAGVLSTVAMLHGRGAERFLRREGIKAWWVR